MAGLVRFSAQMNRDEDEDIACYVCIKPFISKAVLRSRGHGSHDTLIHSSARFMFNTLYERKNINQKNRTISLFTLVTNHCSSSYIKTDTLTVSE